VTSELARVAGPTRLADALAAHRDSAGRSAMHAAAELGLPHGCALLAALCPALAATPDAGGVTPLGLAARAGAADAGKALLDAGADADDDDTVRRTRACLHRRRAAAPRLRAR
jgi:ankyrin repeat protein